MIYDRRGGKSSERTFPTANASTGRSCLNICNALAYERLSIPHAPPRTKTIRRSRSRELLLSGYLSTYEEPTTLVCHRSSRVWPHNLGPGDWMGHLPDRHD